MILAFLLAPLFSGCGGDGGSPTNPPVIDPPPGSIRLNLLIEGGGTDSDGFVILLDGEQRGVILGAGPFVLSPVPPGTHTVELGGLAENCIPLGEASKRVNVQSESEALAEFVVDCSLPPIPIGEGVRENINGSEGSRRFFVLLLEPVAGAPRFAPAGDAARSQLITFSLGEGAGDADLFVRWGEPPTSTDFDCASRGNGNQESCAFENAPPGEWYVMVLGKEAFSDVSLSSEIRMIPGTGTISVSAPTQGVDLDDQFTVIVDGTVTGFVPANGVAGPFELEEGAYSVTLGDVDFDCSLEQNAIREIVVSPDSHEEVVFGVQCEELPRMVLIKTTSTGDANLDGYTVKVNGSAVGIIAANGELGPIRVSHGEQTIEVSGLHPHCDPQAETELLQRVIVSPNSQREVSFIIECRELAPSHLAFLDENGDPLDGIDDFTITEERVFQALAFADDIPIDRDLVFEIDENGRDAFELEDDDNGEEEDRPRRRRRRIRAKRDGSGNITIRLGDNLSAELQVGVNPPENMLLRTPRSILAEKEETIARAIRLSDDPNDEITLFVQIENHGKGDEFVLLPVVWAVEDLESLLQVRFEGASDEIRDDNGDGIPDTVAEFAIIKGVKVGMGATITVFSPGTTGSDGPTIKLSVVSDPDAQHPVRQPPDP